MGWFSRRKKRRAAAHAEYVPDNTASVAAFATLYPYATIDPAEQEREADEDDIEQAQDEQEADAPDDAPVDETYSAGEHGATQDTVTDYYQPTYDSSPSYDSGSSSSYDSGSSYSSGDSGGSSYSDGGSSYSDGGSSSF